MDPVAQLLASQLAAFLALLLAASAAHKWLSWQRTRRVVQEFAGVPRSAASPAVAAAGLLELLAGALLMAPRFRSIGGLLAALLLATYLALIVRALARDRREVDCGCRFGPAQHALGAFEVWRNGILTAFALLVAGSAANGAAPVTASQAFAACALVTLYAALDQVMGMRPVRGAPSMRPGAVL